MKKIFVVALSLCLIFCLAACGNGSYDKTDEELKEEGISVYATVVIDGQGKRSNDKATCKDLDGDGFIDVLEVMQQLNSNFFVIHDYETIDDYFTYETSDSGATVTKFFGVDGTNWGIFVNDEPVTSLYDAVFEDSRITVFSYMDTENYSDMYAFFKEVSVEGENHTLQLLGYKYDENFELVTVPVEGAEVLYETEDGEEIYTTDEEGNVTIPYGEKSVVLVAEHPELIMICPAYYSDSSGYMK